MRSRVELLWTKRVLAGGIETDEPLAGGALQPFEEQMCARFGCSDRPDLNRFFCSEDGRIVLKQAYQTGAYRLRYPEEAILLVQAEVPAGELRCYPELLSTAPPDPGEGWRTHRMSVGQLREVLSAYESPLELQRMGESLRLWRPYYEELLALLAETCEQNWPLQSYPQGWSARVEATLDELGEKVYADPACGYPQRGGSNLRQLMSILGQAAEAPESLTGRQVGLARTILADSEQRWGPIGSGGRARALQSRLDSLPQVEPGRLIAVLLKRLEPFDPEEGLEQPCSVLSPVDGEAVPEAIRDRVLRARTGTLDQLIEWGLLGSLEALGELAPRLTAQVLFKGESDPARGRLLQRSYLVYRGLRPWSGRPPFEQQPWLASLVRPTASRTEAALQLCGELVEVSWRHFPQYAWPASLRRELSTLRDWAGLADLHDERPDSWCRVVSRRFDWARAARLCAEWIESESCKDLPRVYQQQRQARALATAQERWAFFTRGSHRVTV